MEPVLSLVKYPGALVLHYRMGDFFTAMGWQAMHEDGVIGGKAKQIFIDCESLKRRKPVGRFGFLAHRGPHVGIDTIHTINGLARIMGQKDLAVTSR